MNHLCLTTLYVSWITPKHSTEALKALSSVQVVGVSKLSFFGFQASKFGAHRTCTVFSGFKLHAACADLSTIVPSYIYF